MTDMCEKLLPEVLEHLVKLALRYDNTVTKKRRLWDLSSPRCRSTKFEPPYIDIVNRNKTRIVRLEEPVLSRSEQLSLPRSRKLLELKKSPAFHEFEPLRKSNVNRRVRKSLLSVYSRLGNVQPPQKPVKPPQLSKAELKFHADYTKRLAKPKALPKPPQVERTKKIYNKKRTKKLAKPKVHQEEPINEWKFTRALQNYQPSQRIRNLAIPKQSLMQESNPNAFKVKKSALHYNVSRRIVELSLPSVTLSDQNVRKNVNVISSSALSAKPSKRIIDLAEPRVRSLPKDLPLPYISRKALKAKISKRLIELAKPKQYHIY
ncbi:uncharacterized protein LOC119681796 [Teleopsis dalmanni]|uniref:uncharacterized protein LOC119681796 n=1 Tax=Teleopsis dalmanni TaxID=139649 RepID=UPI000D32C246|nr:uncharacterized protein LOC119681796 [Teleopsis dalmanni]